MNIFISNLSYEVADGDLRHLFEEFGEVSSAKVMTDRFSGRSKGFGFVEMPDNEASLKAIAKLNQVEYDGKVIAVAEARPREERPKRRECGRQRQTFKQQLRRPSTSKYQTLVILSLLCKMKRLAYPVSLFIFA